MYYSKASTVVLIAGFAFSFVNCSAAQASNGTPGKETSAATSEKLSASDSHADARAPKIPRIFVEADQDKDGKVSLVEAKALGTSRFASADKNTDGALDTDELKTLKQSFGRHPHGPMLARLDQDKDGKLSRTEAPPPHAEAL